MKQSTNKIVINRLESLAKENILIGHKSSEDFDIDKYPWLFLDLDTDLNPCTFTESGIKFFYDVFFTAQKK